MRTAITTAALVLMASSATAQVYTPTDSGNLLWQKEQADQIKLVPSRVIPTAMPGVSLYTDVDKNTSGTISNIGGGQYLINQQGEQNKLTIVTEQPGDGLTWR